MVHFRAASWYKEAVEKQNYKKISPEKWLERNKRYWFDPKMDELEKENAPVSDWQIEEKPSKKVVSTKSIIALRKRNVSSRKIYLTRT